MFSCRKVDCDVTGSPHVHASSLARPMNCAGSLFFKDLPPDQTNEAAENGTACGELLAFYLTKPGQAAPSNATNGVMFDGDMKFYALDVGKEIFSKAGSEVLCEQRVDWQTRSGIWIRGRYDASFVGYDARLYIDDLKYGYGIVEAKENWQLIAYAIGEIIRRGQMFKEIVLRIHQPRAHHEDGPTREWVITYEQLLEYKEQIELKMEAIVTGYRALQTSKECKYCPAAANCPAHNKAYHRGIEIAHDFMQDNIDDDELGFQIELADRVADLIKTRQRSLELLAVTRIKNGKLVKGFGVEESYGHRQWKNGVSAEAIRMLTGKDLMKSEMLSPAQAEKMGVPKELVEQSAAKKFLGPKLKRVDAAKLGEKIFGKQ